MMSKDEDALTEQPDSCVAERTRNADGYGAVDASELVEMTNALYREIDESSSLGQNCGDARDETRERDGHTILLDEDTSSFMMRQRDVHFLGLPTGVSDACTVAWICLNGTVTVV